MIYYNEMNKDIINSNLIKKKIINNDIGNSLNLDNSLGQLHKTNCEINQNKYINNINFNDLNYQRKALRKNIRTRRIKVLVS